MLRVLLLVLFLPWGLLCVAEGADVDKVEILSSLIDPKKLDSLEGDRAANGRLRKICYWLEVVKRNGMDLNVAVKGAQERAGYAGTARADADLESLMRNLTILERLGCLNEEGMAKLRKGNAPTITKGPYTGDIASVDHIIPRSIVPELDERLYNLEFMPSRMNGKKGNGIGQRQRALAVKWCQLGLVSEKGRSAVLSR